MNDDEELAMWSEVIPLGDLLVRSAHQTPDRDALVLPGQRYTHAELFTRAVGVARSLLSLGARRGDHVGILAHNGIEFVESLFGVALMGGVAVPVNARHRTDELDHIAENADLVGFLTLGSSPGAYLDFPNVLAQALDGLDAQTDVQNLRLSRHPRLRFVVAMNGEAGPGLMSRSEFDEFAGRTDLRQVHHSRGSVRVRDAAMLLYTSGTTAHPKGCVLSHEALTRGAVHRARHRYGAGGPDVTWGAGPLYHIGSLSPFLGSIGACGTYVTDTYFDVDRAVDLMAQEGVTVAFPWFPAIMQPILDHPRFDARALPHLRSILVIGPRPLIEQVQQTFPHAEMLAACGMTETAGIYAISDRLESVEERSEAQGKAVPGIELRIVDIATGEDLPDGQMGEMLIRGYCVMTEYYRDPAKTAETLSADGWLRTGDLYSRTPDGRVVFHGRLKDMLKIGGENVATIEIESFLCRHPAVRMASVVGRPDTRLDEVAVAFVEVEPGQHLTEDELLDFCRGKISSYKIPAEVHFLGTDEWPMSTTKINKRGLRARLEDSKVGSA
jgi:acyl-CoA synthetase (AMP-forming)/AMP-acid ligase II